MTRRMADFGHARQPARRPGPLCRVRRRFLRQCSRHHPLGSLARPFSLSQPTQLLTTRATFSTLSAAMQSHKTHPPGYSAAAPLATVGRSSTARGRLSLPSRPRSSRPVSPSRGTRAAGYPAPDGDSIPPGCVGHQWIDHRPWDESIMADYLPGIDPTPQQPPPSPIKENDMPLFMVTNKAGTGFLTDLLTKKVGIPDAADGAELAQKLAITYVPQGALDDAFIDAIPG